MKYTTAQIGFHWLTTALVLIMFATGFAYLYEIGDATVMQVHQIAGQLMIFVLVIRIITRFTHSPRPAETIHPRLQQIAAKIVHLCLYLTLITFVITGYVSASAETNNALLMPVNLGFARSDTGEWLLEMHYKLKWVLLALVGLHIAAALKHHFWDRDQTLSHMSFANRKG